MSILYIYVVDHRIGWLLPSPKWKTRSALSSFVEILMTVSLASQLIHPTGYTSLHGLINSDGSSLLLFSRFSFCLSPFAGQHYKHLTRFIVDRQSDVVSAKCRHHHHSKFETLSTLVKYKVKQNKNKPGGWKELWSSFVQGGPHSEIPKKK